MRFPETIDAFPSLRSLSRGEHARTDSHDWAVSLIQAGIVCIVAACDHVVDCRNGATGADLRALKSAEGAEEDIVYCIANCSQEKDGCTGKRYREGVVEGVRW